MTDDNQDNEIFNEEEDFVHEEELPLEEETLIENEKVPPLDKGTPMTAIDQISIDQIPVPVHLEMARFTVSLDELQKMEVGSKLPIEINPRIVNLVVGDKTIGKGEIVEFGDIIGVKILELYS